MYRMFIDRKERIETMKKTLWEYEIKTGKVDEIRLIQDSLDYDFRNLKLSALAHKIKSQLTYKPKPKMFNY